MIITEELKNKSIEILGDPAREMIENDDFYQLTGKLDAVVVDNMDENFDLTDYSRYVQKVMDDIIELNT